MVNGPMSQVRPNVLVVDDDAAVRDSFVAVLGKQYELLFATNGPEALRVLGSHDIRLVLLDIRMPGMDGIEVLRRIKEMNEQTDVIVVTAVKSLKTAVEAIKLGAFDYVTKPFDIHEILALAKRVVEKQDLLKEVLYLRSEVARDHQFENLVGKNARMQEIYEFITDISNTDSTVLIQGESGTGKELIAKAIHFNSTRKNKPFIVANCSAYSQNLLESELFGHEKGAFAGAIRRKIGRFELAHGGTIFLDEIGEISPPTQILLLRVLQDHRFERVGGEETLEVDVRVIAATNKNLTEEMKKGTFREDLYYRLNVIPIWVPPLRERKDDVPLLASHFLKKFSHEKEKDVQGFSAEVMEIFLAHAWPGNIRELENVVEHAVIIAKQEKIQAKDLPQYLLQKPLAGQELITLQDYEKDVILKTLEETGWNKNQTAKRLKINRSTLYGKMKRYGLVND